jgi:tetratricopeptide (TPR) repeat protein
LPSRPARRFSPRPPSPARRDRRNPTCRGRKPRDRRPPRRARPRRFRPRRRSRPRSRSRASKAKIKDDPNNRPALAELAGYYLTTGHPDKALGLTQRLLSLGEKTAQVYYLDGIANQSMGRIKEATDDFEQATNREPTNAQVLLTLTNLYLQTNRVADAERVSKRATTFNANDKTAWLNYGLVLAQEKKYDEARVALRIRGQDRSEGSASR